MDGLGGKSLFNFLCHDFISMMLTEALLYVYPKNSAKNLDQPC